MISDLASSETFTGRGSHTKFPGDKAASDQSERRTAREFPTSPAYSLCGEENGMITPRRSRQEQAFFA